MEETRSNKVNVLGIISFILGILSCIWPWFIPGGALVGLILGVIAIILASVSLHRNGRNGFGIAGLILGIIGVIIFILFLLVFVVFIGGDFGTILVGLLFA